MAQQFPEITPPLAKFIAAQHVFFTASAAASGRVNVSPREASALRVLSPRAVVYLDRTGSGNETAAHLRADGRMTIMFCAFEGPPRILRLYGQGRILRPGNPDCAEILAAHYPAPPPGTRQLALLAVDLVQTSCGYGVPLFDFVAERPVLEDWARQKGPEGIEDYWRDRNTTSIDGLPTGILED